MRIKGILLGIGLLLGIVTISCETKSSESEEERKQTINNIGQRAVMDTSDMDKIQEVPVIPAPGAQIDRDKVTTMLDEENVSFKEVTKPNATMEDIEDSIEQLNTLLDTDRVRNDDELKYFVHSILGSSYRRFYEKTGRKDHLDQAEKHVDTAISMFKDQPEYKADLVGAYTNRLIVYSLQDESDKALSLRKYLIEEFQDVGYGFYKNWFASREVEALYNWVRVDSLGSEKNQEIVNYLTDIADTYDNEVGITAQMSLARYYASEGQQDKAEELTESVKQQLGSLDNPEFKEDKWLRFKTDVESIAKRESESGTQAQRDTLFYEIHSDMIDRATISKDERQSTYRLSVQLEQDYHSDYAQKTTDNIGNFLAIVYNDEIISSSFPTIQTGISNGRFSLGPYEQKEKAEKVLNKIKGGEQ